MWGQFMTLYTMQLRHLLRARKTIILSILQLIPVLGVLLFVIFGDIDGMALFRDFTAKAILIFMMPLAALFMAARASSTRSRGARSRT